MPDGICEAFDDTGDRGVSGYIGGKKQRAVGSSGRYGGQADGWSEWYARQ